MKEPTCMEEEFGPINYQCWICPECDHDHLKGRSCSPKSDKPFSPSLDDHSYIAEKYRELEAKLLWQSEMLERAKQIMNDGRDPEVATDPEMVWRKDLEAGMKGEKNE